MAAAADAGRFFVSDGQIARATYPTLGGIQELDEFTQRVWFREQGVDVACRIWPTRSLFGLFGSCGTMQLLTDQENPALRIIAAESFVGPDFGFVSSGDRRLSEENTQWFDPARDDIPIRHIKRTYEKDGKTVEQESEENFLEFKQLSGGRWYPTRWRQSLRTHEDGQLKPYWTREYRLQIQQNVAIDPVWFKLPEVTAQK